MLTADLLAKLYLLRQACQLGYIHTYMWFGARKEDVQSGLSQIWGAALLVWNTHKKWFLPQLICQPGTHMQQIQAAWYPLPGDWLVAEGMLIVVYVYSISDTLSGIKSRWGPPLGCDSHVLPVCVCGDWFPRLVHFDKCTALVLQLCCLFLLGKTRWYIKANGRKAGWSLLCVSLVCWVESGTWLHFDVITLHPVWRCCNSARRFSLLLSVS